MTEQANNPLAESTYLNPSFVRASPEQEVRAWTSGIKLSVRT